LSGLFGIVNVRIRKNLFLTYFLHLFLAFQRHQFHHNPIFELKITIKIQRRAHSGFFKKITDFADFFFLKFKIDLELNLSKSEFAVIIQEFDVFSTKTCKIQKKKKKKKKKKKIKNQIITKLRT
jgi:hypothetical protein